MHFIIWHESTKIFSSYILSILFHDNCDYFADYCYTFIIEKDYSHDLKGTRFTGYGECANNPDSPNRPGAKKTQFTFAPIPKKTRQYIYHESGF